MVLTLVYMLTAYPTQSVTANKYIHICGGGEGEEEESIFWWQNIF